MQGSWNWLIDSIKLAEHYKLNADRKDQARKEKLSAWVAGWNIYNLIFLF